MTYHIITAMQFGAGVALVALAWMALRRACGTKLLPFRPILLAMDALPVVTIWLTITALTARPMVSGVIVAAMAFGLIRGNIAKRAASSEPLIFTDGLLGGIFFYPSLYAEFVTPPVLLRAIAMVVLSFVVLGWIERPLWQAFWPGLIGVAAILISLCFLRPSRTVERALATKGVPAVTGLPEVDSSAYGPIASVVIHTMTAQRDRVMRQQNRSPGRSDSLPICLNPAGPMVLMQLESFFDARRLGPFVPADLLPHYDQCVASSVCHGEFEAPSYGANTVRTEFAALTGLSESVLGLDRFNPYAAYARVPIDTIAWRLRAAGFRTVCIHPFAGSFYGRRKVMPNLGFDEFRDISTFARYDRGSTYISDLTVIREIERVLEENGPRTFIFAITMGNHSPWKRPMLGPALNLPRGVAFARFLGGLAETDIALGAMAELMRRRWPQGLYGAFGDHLPSFPGLYRELGHVSRATDYVICRSDESFSERRDIQAADLPGLLLRMAEWKSSQRRQPLRIARAQP